VLGVAVGAGRNGWDNQGGLRFGCGGGVVGCGCRLFLLILFRTSRRRVPIHMNKSFQII